MEGVDWPERWADADEARRRAPWFSETVSAVVRANGGFLPLDQGVGERGFAVFTATSPAMVAALELVTALAKADHTQRGGVEGLTPEMRGAIHTGPVLIDGDSARGVAVHLCARLRAMARAGELLASDAFVEALRVERGGQVRDLEVEDVVVRDVGLHQVRDFGQPHRLFRLSRPEDRGSASPPNHERTPVRVAQVPVLLPTGTAARVAPSFEFLESQAFVGRSALLDELVASQAMPSGSGSPPTQVFLHGPSGIGKSRLAARAAAIARNEGTTVLWAEADSVATGPFPALAAAIDCYLEQVTFDQLVATVGPIVGDLARFLPKLRGFDPLAAYVTDLDHAQTRAYAAAVTFLRTLARHHPVLCVIDGSEMLDVGTRSFIDTLTREPSLGRLTILHTTT